MFNTITVNNAFIDDVTYNFHCYVAVNSANPFSSGKLIIYQLSIAVTPPLEWEDQ